MEPKAKYQQRGETNPFIVVTVVLSVLVVGLTGFGIWAYINYTDYKNNVDEKVAAAEAEAKRKQSIEDEIKFAEREKEPTRVFVGPDDYGRVQVSYPKTWSVFVEKDGKTAGVYQAYMHPGVVPPIGSGTPYAIKLSIENTPYEKVLQGYESAVKKGDLKSSPVAVQGENGTRLDGNFSKEIQGSMVIFKVRDKTLRVMTESRTFQPDFDAIILKSLTFNK